MPALTLLLAQMGCTTPKDVEPLAAVESGPLATLNEVTHFCGACHPTPRPESFPKDRWPFEVERGYQFYLMSERTDLRLPRQSGVVNYFQASAPEQLQLPAPPEMDPTSRFSRAEYGWTKQSDGAPAVAHLLNLKTSNAMTNSLVICDMRVGVVDWLKLRENNIQLSHRETLKHPDHICPTDLDADGRPDFIVSDLGSFLPEDHQRGRVVWLKPGEKPGEFEQIVLLSGVGRVADAEAADFDGDGDLDVIVAVFGWQTTGGVLLLRQTGQQNGRPEFATEVIDPRHGAIHVCIADVNVDGRPDVVALLAQEHEAIEAFVTQPDGTFQREPIYQAPDPSYGSSGIQVVDLDGDGDQDVLYTNGDTFDSHYVKPYHSVRWIENRGGGEWQDHLILNLPGVHRALAADLDGDGDQDFAACCFIPHSARERQPEVATLASLLWFEQRAGSFLPHAIESGNCVHASLEIADINGDGAPDILVGNFDPATLKNPPKPFDVWLSRTPPMK